MKVQFKEVGRSRKSWESELPDLDYRTLYKAVKKANALGSRGIDFERKSNGLLTASPRF